MSVINQGTVTSTAAAILAINSATKLDTIVFVISGLTSETISVVGVVKGAVTTAKLRPVNLNTLAVEATDADLGNGTFQLLDMCYEALTFTKSSTTESATITYNAKEYN